MRFFLQAFMTISILCNLTFANVVVSSKAIYLIVAPLLKGVDTPKLLINHGQCGHHHHLKPSEVQLIKLAKIVFWNGAVHEPFMSKIIESAAVNHKIFDEVDGFSWLSPVEVIKKLPAIVAVLKSIYPECDHAKIDDNVNMFISSLKSLHEKIRMQLAPLKGKEILTTYPFLTYFAREYEIIVAGYMMVSPEESMTPQRLRNMYKILGEKRVVGIVKDHHVPFNVIRSLTQKYKTPVLVVDTEGIDVLLNAQEYNILIERLAQSIVKWAK